MSSREYNRAYYERNKERLKEAARRYYHANRERARAKNKEWHENNREKAAAKQREWYRRNPEKIKKFSRTTLIRSHGISVDEYDAMLAAQGGKCAICRRECSVAPNLSIDHCHATGGVRGLLCRSCNSGLGFFRDSTDALRKAAEYLDAYNSIERIKGK